MAHNDFLRPGNCIYPDTPPLSGDLARLDQACVECLSTVGADYTLSKPLAIGGQGLALTTASRIRGGLETRRGARIRHGDNDFISFNSTRPRASILTITRNDFHEGNTFKFVRSPHWGMQGGGGIVNPLRVFIPPRLLQNGATLATVTLSIRVAPHPVLPAQMPGFQVGRYAVDGSSDNLLSTIGVNFPVPADGDAWFAGGNAQTLTLTTNQHNVIDATQYVYAIDIDDEQGLHALAGNLFMNLTIGITGVADMRFA